MFAAAISNSAEYWYEAKLFIEHALTVSHDSLHVIAGVLIQLLAAWLLRRTLASWLPWLAVAGLTFANEAVDVWVERWPSAAMQFGEGAKDVGLTLLLPTILLVVARLRPRLFQGRPVSP